MKIPATTLSLGLAVLVLSVPTPPAAGQPAPLFSFGFRGCRSFLEGVPGAPFEHELFSTLSTSNNPDVVVGAQAWSLSIASTGDPSLLITDITTEGTRGDEPPFGLRRDGFEKSELSDPSASTGSCAQFHGAVSTVVLSFTDPAVTLPPERGVEVVARLTLSGTYPTGGDCLPARISYVDGCGGSGGPVRNRVEWRGLELVRVSARECRSEVCGLSLLICPDPEADLQVVFQSENTNFRMGDPFAGGAPPGLAPTPDPHAHAEVVVPQGEVTLYAAILSRFTGFGGVQGWTLSVSLRGDARLLGATTAGTAADIAPVGLREGGFEKTELVAPDVRRFDSNEAQGQGAVSAIVLNFDSYPIPTPSTATVLALTLSGHGGQYGELVWADGLRGSGQPVMNVATVSAEQRRFTCRQRAAVRFEGPEVGDFIRCDPNNDGGHDLADAVWILQELFRASVRTACRAAADCNSDGIEDLSDVLYAVAYLFLGGPQPPSPYPDCGGEETINDSSLCPIGSTRCR